MAEHALDRLEASPATPDFLRVLMDAMFALKCEGVWQQLVPEKAIGLAIGALARVSELPTLCVLGRAWLQSGCSSYVARWCGALC
jgi:hypothetical protein